MKNLNTIKHYALPTRTLARQFTNILKEQGHSTTQPKSKNLDHWLVSTNTKFKKPTAKKVFTVVNGQAIQA